VLSRYALVVQIRELKIPDSYEITPKQFGDDRGVFLEWYRADRLAEATGRAIDLKQANTSVSARGTVRGIHFADIPPSQAKYVTATHGAVLDFVVDIRVGSPTFGEWDSVLLDDVDRRAIFLSEGLGHCFVALSDGATVSYLVTDVYQPQREHGISPVDPAIGLTFPVDADDLLLSPKDTEAPTLAQAAEQGILPTWDAARSFYDALKGH
jgi:dTDP-4-dehydrorhamnose 3,5-epimerase